MIAIKLKIIFLLLVAAVSHARETTTLTTPFIVKSHGYPIEDHKVQTSDGYILTMHRIPSSPKLGNNTNTQRPVAFLMHGVTCASSVWVLNGPGRSLAYILSDAGYDVWMGNARGNLYSREHITKNPDSQDFWNFDWHEIGIYDQPAMIDYSLKVSGEKQLRYVGHSQGSTTFFVMAAMLPHIKDRIRSAHLMAPAVFQSHAQSPLLAIGATLLGVPNPIVDLVANTELAPSSRVVQLITEELCKDGSNFQEICSKGLDFLFGGPSPFLNKTMEPEIFAIIPAGNSINQMIHFFQLHKNGQFRQLDYGSSRNRLTYGSSTPPKYNLKNIQIPTYLYYGDNDALVAVEDVNLLINALNSTKTLKSAYRVPYPQWTHLDFVLGIGVENTINKVVLDDMAND